MARVNAWSCDQCGVFVPYTFDSNARGPQGDPPPPWYSVFQSGGDCLGLQFCSSVCGAAYFHRLSTSIQTTENTIKE